MRYFRVLLFEHRALRKLSDNNILQICYSIVSDNAMFQEDFDLDPLFSSKTR
jgi:hypothetical protein